MSLESFYLCVLQILALLSWGTLGRLVNDGGGEQDYCKAKAPSSEKPARISLHRMLTAALESAQRAVQLDKDGSAPEALEEYNRLVAQLDDVLRGFEAKARRTGRASRHEHEVARIRKLRDTYQDRIQTLLLNSGWQ